MAQPSKPEISAIERIGAPVTVVGAVAIAAPLLTLAVAALTGKITLSTSDQINFWVTTAAIVTIGAAVLSLIAVGLHLPALIRAPRGGRIAWTTVSGVALVASVLFLLLTVLPRANNLTHLNNVIEPFGKAIQSDCQTPLNNETSRYKQVEADANAFPTQPNASTILLDLSNLSASMNKDAGLFQQDLTAIQADLPKVQALSLPDGKYGDLKDGCIRDIQGTIGFLNTSSSIPTSQVVQALLAAVPAIPTTELPKADQPIVASTIQSTIPASYSAIGLTQDTSQIAAMKLPLVFPPSVPAADQQSLGLIVYAVLATGYAQLVAGAMNSAATSTDPATTNAGNCFANDIIDTLDNNLTPVKVDTLAIVGQAKMTCTR
jgi:hypothetical protein